MLARVMTPGPWETGIVAVIVLVLGFAVFLTGIALVAAGLASRQKGLWIAGLVLVALPVLGATAMAVLAAVGWFVLAA
jgi:uncharacterized membrane protein YiaA